MLISDFIPVESLDYVKASGTELLERVGHDELREIVTGVICGENIRTATEPLTKRRLAILNAALVVTLTRASVSMPPARLLEQAMQECRTLRRTDPRRTVLMWILGLTEKQVQNVLRSDDAAWKDYVQAATRISAEAAKHSTEAFGELEWKMEILGRTTRWDWLWAHTLMVPVGSQTLATRGSEKSMYGKFFEKLVMGSVLGMLGFSLDTTRSGGAMTYWLSEQSERRESDATALVGGRQGVRFDIGFIGPGNPEITLDKVTRFERFAEISGQSFELTTIIIVDRIADGSRVVELAEMIDGRVLQMSSSLWVKDLDRIVGDCCDAYRRVFSSSAGVAKIKQVASMRMKGIDIEELLRAAR